MVFLIFLYKIFLEKRKKIFFLLIFCLSITFWIGINIANPDAFIARKNIERLDQGKELDPFYFSRLSDDAIPETVKIFQMNVDEKIKMEIARDLYYHCDSPPELRCYEDYYKCEPISFKKKIEYAEKKQNENWQSLNISERKALLALKENYQEIVKYQGRYFKKEAEECWERMKNCAGEKWGCDGRKACEMYEKKAEMDK